MDNQRDGGMILGPGAGWLVRSDGQKSHRRQRKKPPARKNGFDDRAFNAYVGALFSSAGTLFTGAGNFSGRRCALASPRPAARYAGIRAHVNRRSRRARPALAVATPFAQVLLTLKVSY